MNFDAALDEEFDRFESDNLVFRPWLPEIDADLAFPVYSDPLVLRYIGNPPPPENPSELQKRLENYASVKSKCGDGSRVFAVETKVTPGIPMGAVFFRQLMDGDKNLMGDFEIGWHVRRDYWGKGIGTEIARTMLFAAKKIRPDLPNILALSYPENFPSMRIMQKIGMHEVGLTDKYFGLKTVMYELILKESQS